MTLDQLMHDKYQVTMNIQLVDNMTADDVRSMLEDTQYNQYSLASRMIESIEYLQIED